MLTDRYDPVDLFALVPQLSLQMEPELAQLDCLLEDDLLFQRIKADLAKRFPQTATRGRPSTPVEVLLRMLVVKRLYGWSYEETERFVSDSLILRQFCRLGFHRAPDDTTLLRWANQIDPATVEALNDRVVALAQQLKVTRGRKLRVDTTLVETNIHHPTDGSLLADAVRVLGRLLRGAKKALGGTGELGKRTFTSHDRSARWWVRVIHGYARRVREEQQPRSPSSKRDQEQAPHGRKAPRKKTGSTGEEAAPKKRKSAREGMNEAYRRLIAITKQSVAQAKRVRGVLAERKGKVAAKLHEQLEAIVPRAQQVIDQARRRVIEGVTVPAKEKLVSLFERHTQIVKRGKAGRLVEFGRKVRLDEVEGGIISGYGVLPEPGSDAPYLKESVAKHKKQFGKAPHTLAADRSFSTGPNLEMARDAGVKRVVIPAVGNVSPERKKQEKQGWFRRGYRFRAGSEGRISVLKRRFGLRRCLDHGEEGMERWVGWGVVTSNLLQIARATAAK